MRLKFLSPIFWELVYWLTNWFPTFEKKMNLNLVFLFFTWCALVLQVTNTRFCCLCKYDEVCYICENVLTSNKIKRMFTKIILFYNSSKFLFYWNTTNQIVSNLKKEELIDSFLHYFQVSFIIFHFFKVLFSPFFGKSCTFSNFHIFFPEQIPTMTGKDAFYSQKLPTCNIIRKHSINLVRFAIVHEFVCGGGGGGGR